MTPVVAVQHHAAGQATHDDDRLQVLALRPDESLLLSSLDGRGKTTVPSRYVKGNVALAYAVTVHKGQGLTTDRAVLLVDGATTAEHLYVGLTRGREHNLACVVCEPLDDGHGHQPAPSAQDVLAAALRRTGNEASATKADRAGQGSLVHPDADKAVLVAALRRQQDVKFPSHVAAAPLRPSRLPMTQSLSRRHPFWSACRKG